MENKLCIQQLQLKDFRNYHQLELFWSGDLNGITGLNGAGKTNILDAIYYICTSKSYFNSSEQFNFRHETEWMELSSKAAISDRVYEISIKVSKGRKKDLTINRVKEDKISAFVGRFPVVMIAPGDNEIVIGGSEERRRLIDSGLCQADSLYTNTLIQYNKVLTNRNALLKQFAEQGKVDEMLIQTFDTMLSDYGHAIYQQRKSFMASYSEEVGRLYQLISGDKEVIQVNYLSHLHDKKLDDLLLSNRAKDLVLHRTTKGIHLDDLELILDGYPVRKTASQGQQKTLVVALKLALYTLLKNRKFLYPVLLLDDIFEKFDLSRVSRLFELIGEGNAGQVFITDTDQQRLTDLLKQTGRSFKMFFVKENNVEEI